MGFGLCSFGFIFLMLDSVGLNFVGYGLMAWGFFGVAGELRAYKGYKLAAIAAALSLPFALIDMYLFVGPYFDAPKPDWLLILKGVALAISGAVLAFGHCNSTARIAEDGGARVFAFRARATMYLTGLYMALTVGGAIGQITGGIAAVILVGKYVIYFLNAWLLFTCFTTITTRDREKVEKEIIKRETEELVRKRALKDKKKAEDAEV